MLHTIVTFTAWAAVIAGYGVCIVALVRMSPVEY
jgi:hypothetical protein